MLNASPSSAEQSTETATTDKPHAIFVAPAKEYKAEARYDADATGRPSTERRIAAEASTIPSVRSKRRHASVSAATTHDAAASTFAANSHRTHAKRPRVTTVDTSAQTLTNIDDAYSVATPTPPTDEPTIAPAARVAEQFTPIVTKLASSSAPPPKTITREMQFPDPAATRTTRSVALSAYTGKTKTLADFRAPPKCKLTVDVQQILSAKGYHSHTVFENFGFYNKCDMANSLPWLSVAELIRVYKYPNIVAMLQKSLDTGKLTIEKMLVEGTDTPTEFILADDRFIKCFNDFAEIPQSGSSNHKANCQALISVIDTWTDDVCERILKIDVKSLTTPHAAAASANASSGIATASVSATKMLHGQDDSDDAENEDSSDGEYNPSDSDCDAKIKKRPRRRKPTAAAATASEVGDDAPREEKAKATAKVRARKKHNDKAPYCDPDHVDSKKLTDILWNFYQIKPGVEGALIYRDQEPDAKWITVKTLAAILQYSSGKSKLLKLLNKNSALTIKDMRKADKEEIAQPFIKLDQALIDYLKNNKSRNKERYKKVAKAFKYYLNNKLMTASPSVLPSKFVPIESSESESSPSSKKKRNYIKAHRGCDKCDIGLAALLSNHGYDCALLDDSPLTYQDTKKRILIRAHTLNSLIKFSADPTGLLKKLEPIVKNRIYMSRKDNKSGPEVFLEVKPKLVKDLQKLERPGWDKSLCNTVIKALDEYVNMSTNSSVLASSCVTTPITSFTATPVRYQLRSSGLTANNDAVVETKAKTTNKSTARKKSDIASYPKRSVNTDDTGSDDKSHFSDDSSDGAGDPASDFDAVKKPSVRKSTPGATASAFAAASANTRRTAAAARSAPVKKIARPAAYPEIRAQSDITFLTTEMDRTDDGDTKAVVANKPAEILAAVEPLVTDVETKLEVATPIQSHLLMHRVHDRDVQNKAAEDFANFITYSKHGDFRIINASLLVYGRNEIAIFPAFNNAKEADAYLQKRELIEPGADEAKWEEYVFNISNSIAARPNHDIHPEPHPGYRTQLKQELCNFQKAQLPTRLTKHSPFKLIDNITLYLWNKNDCIGWDIPSSFMTTTALESYKRLRLSTLPAVQPETITVSKLAPEPKPTPVTHTSIAAGPTSFRPPELASNFVAARSRHESTARAVQGTHVPRIARPADPDSKIQPEIITLSKLASNPITWHPVPPEIPCQQIPMAAVNPKLINEFPYCFIDADDNRWVSVLSFLSSLKYEETSPTYKKLLNKFQRYACTPLTSRVLCNSTTQEKYLCILVDDKLIETMAMSCIHDVNIDSTMRSKYKLLIRELPVVKCI